MQDLKITLNKNLRHKIDILFEGENSSKILNEIKYYIKSHEEKGIKFTYKDMELNFDNAVGFVIKKEMKNKWQIQNVYIRR